MNDENNTVKPRSAQIWLSHSCDWVARITDGCSMMNAVEREKPSARIVETALTLNIIDHIRWITTFLRAFFNFFLFFSGLPVWKRREKRGFSLQRTKSRSIWIQIADLNEVGKRNLEPNLAIVSSRTRHTRHCSHRTHDQWHAVESAWRSARRSSGEKVVCV